MASIWSDRAILWKLVLAIVAGTAGLPLLVIFAEEVEVGAVQPPPDPEAEVEPLLRGPVHEAFAEQLNADPKPGLVVPKQPPQLVEELPPEVKPEGDRVTWIPGYWAWDDDRNDFIWISGVWRNLPPGHRWVPGYWIAAEGGWQWISGTWTNRAVEELQYLPEPPETLEAGIVGDPPSEQHFWVPGVWRHQVNRYVWRPGYWSLGSNDWVWVAARYRWTPRGCIYSDGYWDYPLSLRGYLYAPVYFNRPLYATAGYCYTPSIFISISRLIDHFWVRPGYGHYYFGDYYGPRYASWGISPWFRFTRQNRGAYDPLYTYFQQHDRGSWHDHRRTWSRNHDWYVQNEKWRPPHRWQDQVREKKQLADFDEKGYSKDDVTHIHNRLLGRSDRDPADRHDGDLRAVRIDSLHREQMRRQLAGIRDLAQEREKIEKVRKPILPDPGVLESRTSGGRNSPDARDRGPRGSLRLPIESGNLSGRSEGVRDGRERLGKSEPTAAASGSDQPPGARDRLNRLKEQQPASGPSLADDRQKKVQSPATRVRTLPDASDLRVPFRDRGSWGTAGSAGPDQPLRPASPPQLRSDLDHRNRRDLEAPRERHAPAMTPRSDEKRDKNGGLPTFSRPARRSPESLPPSAGVRSGGGESHNPPRNFGGSPSREAKVRDSGRGGGGGGRGKGEGGGKGGGGGGRGR